MLFRSFSIILFSSVCPCLAYVHSLLSVFHSLTISLFTSLSLSSSSLSPYISSFSLSPYISSFSLSPYISSFSLSPCISSFSLSLPIFLLFLSLSLYFFFFSPLSLPFFHPLVTFTFHTSPHLISFLSFLCFVFLSRDHHGMSYTPGYAGK